MATPPVSLPEKFNGQRGAWWATVQGVAKESDMTKQLTHTHTHTHTHTYNIIIY